MLKYNQFIKESSFLKNSNHIGLIDLRMYNKDILLNILSKYKDGSDYIIDNNYILYSFDNNQLEDDINKSCFKQEVDSIFNLKYLESSRTPIELDRFEFSDFITSRVNHYLIKLNNSDDLVMGELQSESLNKFIKYCLDETKKLGLDTHSRYCFITIDQKEVESGKSQRDFGWHLDGLQGDEVSEKQKSDYQFLWADNTPTRFCTQEFNIKDLNLSKHNVFNFLGSQVIDKNCYSLEKNRIYLMNPYHLHSASISDTKLYRRFVRLSFTNTPITSVKMTVNPDIIYNYDIHKTSGNIPTNLL